MILKTYQGIEARGNDEGSFPFSHPNNLVVGITIIASFFSFLHIGQKSMWFDEVHSVFFAKLPWSGALGGSILHGSQFGTILRTS